MTAPQIKVKIQRRPTLKLKVLPKFPAGVTAESPILLGRTGGNYAFSLDLDALADLVTPLIPPTPPGGLDTQIQYNFGGVFGGISGATTDGVTVTLVSPVINQINPSTRTLLINAPSNVSGEFGKINLRGSDNGAGAGTSISGNNNVTTSWAVGSISSFLGGAYSNTMGIFAVNALNFYSNATFSGWVNTSNQWQFGNFLTPIASGPVATFNKNASATPLTAPTIAPAASIVTNLIGSDGNNCIEMMQAYGTGIGNSTVHLHARGTQASPTASGANDLIAEWGAWPYATSATPGYVASAGAGIQAIQTEACTDSASGAKLSFWATPNGTATSAFIMTLQTGLAVGAGAADPAAGVVNVSTGYRIANAATSGNVLRGNGTNFVSAALGVSDLTTTATNDSATAGDLGEYVASNTSFGSATVTMTIASPCVVTWASIPYAGASNWTAPITFTTSGALPTGVTASTQYWIIGSTVSGNTFQIATSIANALAGTAINTSGTQSGTHTGNTTVPLTSNAAANVAAISLTAGDWMVWGSTVYNPAGGTTSSYYATWSSSTSATTPSAPNFGGYSDTRASFSAGNAAVISAGLQRFSLNATTTIYLSTLSTFAVSTNAAWGFIGARRVR